MSDKPQGIHWAIWAVVTILVAIIGAFGTYLGNKNSSEKPPPENTNLTSDKLPGNRSISSSSSNSQNDLKDKYKSEIETGVRLYLTGVEKVTKTLNTNDLAKYMSGEIVVRQTNNINSLRQNGAYRESEHSDIKIEIIDIEPNELQATVETRAIYSSYTYSRSNGRCLYRVLPTNLLLEMTLDKTINGWLVNKSASNLRLNRQDC
ncbi:MAG: IMS domain-containing protein [Mastigocoleus sp. MO_167.B18]|nr:IMS domain-containing protein [Mastigocoleus sp. MO_167.B18]